MARKSRYALSVVVPVYNEEESLPHLYQEVSAALGPLADHSYELILVDDGSTDRSYEVAKELYDKDPRHVRLICLRRNFGQTAAMAAGFDAAKGDVVIPMDADLQNDPADIPRLVEQIDAGYDVVSGWRADRKDHFISRRLPSIIANGLISRMTGVHLHDYGCTLKAYHRDVAGHLNFYGELHRFLPALAHWSGASVTEIKVNHRARQFGTSKYGIDRTIRVVLDLITIKFLMSYSTKPMQIFGKWGFVLMGLGFLSGILTGLFKILPPHRDVTDNPWMFICIFLMLSGLQLICMGLLGEISIRTYYESQRKPIYTVREMLEGPPAPPAKPTPAAKTKTRKKPAAKTKPKAKAKTRPHS